MSQVDLECKLARNYTLANVPGSLAYLLIKAVPNRAVDFGSLPLNLALVIDASRSMKGKKIESAKEAAKLAVESLRPDDMVSVIVFSDDATAIVPSSQAQEKAFIVSAIDRIRTGGGTRMYCGMEAAVREMRKATEGASIRRMIVLTDGETEGEEPCLAIAEHQARNNLVISTFGIGDKYNEDLLKAISDVSMGQTHHLQMPEQIQSHFQAEVGASCSAVITNVALSLRPGKDVRLEEIHRIFPGSGRLRPEMDPDESTLTAKVSNLRKDETSCFGARLILPPRPSSRVRIAQILLKYDVPGLKIEGQVEKCDIMVDYTKDHDLCRGVDREVIDYFNQLNVQSLIEQAIKETKVGNVAGATQILAQAEALTRSIGNAPLTRSIQQATQELVKSGTISSGAAKAVKVGSSHTIRINNSSPR